MNAPLPTPSLSKSKGEPAVANPFENDLGMMVLLWSSGNEKSRAMALEIADRNRENARSEK